MYSRTMSLSPRMELAALLCVCLQISTLAAARTEKMLLEDLKVLTLTDGKWTNYRRSSAVPQLKCVGGTAGCSSFRPQTVQCYNRGSDGYDVQWECKTDMDNSYRFGKIQVSCEGYDYSDDPYILKGSCGLEYTIDLTQEGHEQKNAGGHHYGDGYHDRSQYHHGYTKKASSVFQDLIYLAIVVGIVYIIYKKCIASDDQQQQQQQHPHPTAPPPSYEDTFRNQGNQQQPPPYGFSQDYMPNNQGGSCSSGAGYTHTNTNTAPGANTQGGFWSGAFGGGILGYLLGRNTSYTHHRPHTGWWGARPGWGTGWGNSWGSGWGGNSWGSGWGGNSGGSGWGSRTHTTTRSSGFSSAPRSSGTRTASGFGGTSRR